MRLADFGWLVAGVILNALAQLGLKMATTATGEIGGNGSAFVAAGRQLAMSVPFWLALTAYGVSVLVWIVGLSRVPVSQAYPLLSLGYVINIGLAWWLLGEVPNVQRVAGIAVIVAGVILVTRS